MKQALLVVSIGLLLGGCGKHYWEAPGRGVSDFETDSGQCIQESKTKYEVSERIYRRCMQAQGWKRIQTQYPSNTQFRGPEDEDEFFSPPNPLSARGLQQSSGGTVDAGQSPAGISRTECTSRGRFWIDGQCRR